MPFLLPIRTITTIDPDGSAVSPVACTGCIQISCGFTCNTPGAQLTFTLIITDSLKNVQSVSVPVEMVADQTAGWGKLFLGRPVSVDNTTFHITGDLAFVKVDIMTPATAVWTLAAEAG